MDWVVGCWRVLDWELDYWWVLGSQALDCWRMLDCWRVLNYYYLLPSNHRQTPSPK